MPYLKPRRYKGAKGGRSGGKSHFFVELDVADFAANPGMKLVGIREVQKSIRYSVKELVEHKIESLGVSHLFDIQRDVINHKLGRGFMVFQGMQDHTAASIKGLEDFDRALVDEANGLSRRSINLLYPTLRKQGSELKFAWNPEFEDDPVETFFKENEGDPDFLLTHTNIDNNPFISDTGWREYERDMERAKGNPNDWAIFEHIWHGAYNHLSDAIVFAGKCIKDEFETDHTYDGPYYGCDFGFAQDPTTFGEWWIKGDRLYCRRDCGAVGLELDETAAFAARHMPGIEKHVIRADSARPESIDYLKRHGLPNMVGADKWHGSVEDGVAFLRSFSCIVLHPDAKGTRAESIRYRHKVNKAGDVLAKIEDKDNHYFDNGRYALAPLIKNNGTPSVRLL